MCGLAGVAGDLRSAERDAFNDMLWMSALRGKHATGVASMATNGDVRILKDTGTPEFLQDLKRYDSLVNVNARVLLGHNRHMTIGANTRYNAHPFQAGEHIVGAHNGTIGERHKIEGYREYDTDSEALYNAIARDGVQETLRNLRGAWALTWIDLEGKLGPTINFLRNSERSLALAMTEDKRVLLWMSEREMLEAVVTRHNIKLTTDGVFNIKTNTWFRWCVPKTGEVFGKPGLREVVHDTSPFLYSQQQGHLPGLGRTLGPPTIGPGSQTSNTQTKKPSEPQNSNEKKPESEHSLMTRAGLPTAGITSPLKKETANSENQSKTSSKEPRSKEEKEYPDDYYSGFYFGGERGNKIQDCPHTAAGPQAKAWRRGFLDGRKHLNTKPTNVTPLFMPGPKRGESIDEKTFRKLTGCTCSWCDVIVEFGSHVQWIDNTSFLCEVCSEGDQKIL